jgi:hypothetical protein
MRKKLRKITVDGKKYAWSVSRPNCDGDGGCLFKIWDNGNLIHEKVVHTENVTPVTVRLTIQQYERSRKNNTV